MSELFRIDWNNCTTAQWDRMLGAVKRPTLPQSRIYAMAKTETAGGRADFGIIDFHGKPIGMVQVQISPFLRYLSVCRIMRGPLWIHDEIPGEMLKEVLRLIRRRYRTRHGRFLVFHPELPDTRANRRNLRHTGFVRRQQGYASIWLDLSPPEAEMRRALKPNWRNKLRQAERNGITIIGGESAKHLDWLLQRYAEDRAQRGYVGPSQTLIRALCRHGRKDHTIRTLIASHHGQRIAGILLACHGRSATYFVGYSGPEGRRLRAHNLLLWHAATLLKEEGMLWFDLGGVNDADAASIARFKEGLGGQPFTLVGVYA
ncbi:MAG: lipid II:glycine glycyltransferase FemX [Alphaproteobacteria bacterium]